MPDAKELALYRTMCRIRAFEDAAEEASRGSVAAFGASLAQSPGTTTTSRFNWGIDETAPNLHPEDRPLL